MKDPELPDKRKMVDIGDHAALESHEIRETSA